MQNIENIALKEQNKRIMTQHSQMEDHYKSEIETLHKNIDSLKKVSARN